MMKRTDHKEIRTKLLILADDLTGALDAGVQFAGKGDTVMVCTAVHDVFAHVHEADVLVIDTESRHIGKEAAYRTVFRLTEEALQAGISRIYKKTDSGLRGNVGAELSAVLQAAGSGRLEFVPAWPEMGRITKDGIHYVNGVPLAESIFARDVLDPVTESRIDRLIRRQSEVDVTRHNGGDEHGIVVYDCADEEELAAAARYIAANDFRLTAGCAGLLAKYPKQSAGAGIKKEICLDEELLVLSGSLNEVTGKQLAAAAAAGAYRVHIPLEKAAAGTWREDEIRDFAADLLKHAETPVTVIDTLPGSGDGLPAGGEAARRIAGTMGELAAVLAGSGMKKTLMIIGGDTLQGFIRKAGITALYPRGEIAPGTVLSVYEYQGNEHCLITRSGGFGPEDQLLKIQRDLSGGMKMAMDHNSKARPIVGITMGDPAGSGPEITVKALLDPSVYERCRPLVVGDAKMISQAAGFAGHPEVRINRVSDPQEGIYECGTIDVYHLDLISDPEKFAIGKVSAEGGNAAFQSVKTVIGLAMAHRVDATVTNALNKEAMELALRPKGIHFDGHTEIYAAYTKTRKYTMMLALHDFRVVHVSTHCSLREACDRVKKERVLEVIELADKACRDLGIEDPKVGVCGLNPHAGEGGLFGREEIDEIIPAIDAAKEKGINAIGPLPPDSAFSQMRGGWYDIIVCMYHDQGHIPTKTLGFIYDREKQEWEAVEGVNVTLGLPIIRTSVDHGTDFAHAGKGTSNEKSLANAIEYALRLAGAGS